MIQKNTVWRGNHKFGMFSVACNVSCRCCPELQMRLEEGIKRVYRKPVTETFVVDSWQYFTCVEDLTWVSVVSPLPYLHLKTNQSEGSTSIFEKRPKLCDVSLKFKALEGKTIRIELFFFFKLQKIARKSSVYNNNPKMTWKVHILIDYS